MRLFVAVEVDDRERSAPEHLTLAFLGEVGAPRVTTLVDALAPVGRSTPPFDLTIEGVGAFPDRDRPRVVWRGVTDGAAEVSRLASDVSRALAPIGFPVPREGFVPHLTLFRVRGPANRRRADDLLRGVEAPPPVRRVHVASFALKESRLGADGATHTTLATFPLEGASGGDASA